MTHLYMPRQTTALSDVAALLADAKLSREQSRDAVALANPQLKQCPEIRPNTWVLLPDSANTPYQTQAHFKDWNRQWMALPPSARQAYVETDPAEMSALLLAIHSFMKDYGMVSAAGDLNTFGGGSVAGLTAQPNGMIKQMREIEDLLAKYSQASGSNKALHKQHVKTAYERLHRQFGPVLNRYVAPAKTNAKQPFLHSPNRALKAANKGHFMPLTNASQNRTIFSAAKNLHWAGKGIAVLDIGFRARNIACSSNPFRQTAIEMAGLAASYYVGVGFGTIGVALALGPVGWVILILVAGTTAILLDNAGKFAISKLWKDTSYLSNVRSTQPYAICR